MSHPGARACSCQQRGRGDRVAKMTPEKHVPVVCTNRRDAARSMRGASRVRAVPARPCGTSVARARTGAIDRTGRAAERTSVPEILPICCMSRLAQGAMRTLPICLHGAYAFRSLPASPSPVQPVLLLRDAFLLASAFVSRIGRCPRGHLRPSRTPRTPALENAPLGLVARRLPPRLLQHSFCARSLGIAGHSDPCLTAACKTFFERRFEFRAPITRPRWKRRRHLFPSPAFRQNAQQTRRRPSRTARRS